MRLRHTPFSPASWHYRRPRCGAVDKDDPWYHFVYDERWRIVAVYRADTTTGDLDDDPKEQFIYHAAGLDGYGSGSYIDTVILRDRDANATGGWAGEADGTLEERRYYAQNWRHDVVAIVTDTGVMAEQVRYSAYGVPFGLPQGDVDGDGTVDNDDRALINAAMDESVGDPGYDVRADLDLDGTVTTADLTIWNANNGATLGWDALSEDPDDGLGNRTGYAGYEHDPTLAASWTLYHVRHRVYNADLGRWTRRDPLGYVDGMSLYAYVGGNALVRLDPLGPCLTCAIDLGLGISGVRYLYRIFRAAHRHARRGVGIRNVGCDNSLRTLKEILELPDCLDCYECVGGPLPTCYEPTPPPQPISGYDDCMASCRGNAEKVARRCFDDYRLLYSAFDHPNSGACATALSWCVFGCQQDAQQCRFGCDSSTPCRRTAIPTYYQEDPYDPECCKTDDPKCCKADDDRQVDDG